jgi:hypothetical protein
MAIVNRQVTLSDTVATQIVGADNMPHDVILHNASKSSNNYIWIAGSSATAGTGTAMHIDDAQTVYMTLRPDDELWAISTPSGLIVHVTDIRRND